jgi:hypothetical protein
MKIYTAMFDEGWARTLPALTGRSPTPSVDDELEVDQLMDDDSPSYDLGWTPLPAPTENDASAGKCLLFLYFYQHVN